jgi:hypothetical protein
MTEIQESKFIEYGLLPPFKYFLKTDVLFNTGCCPKEAIYGQLCTLHADGWLEIKAGYPWDGATCAPDSPDFMRPSLAHDALYRLKQEGFPVPDDWKERADTLLNRLCNEDGSSRVKRFLTRRFVHWFGLARARDLNRYKQTLVAPL